MGTPLARIDFASPDDEDAFFSSICEMHPRCPLAVRPRHFVISRGCTPTDPGEQGLDFFSPFYDRDARCPIDVQAPLCDIAITLDTFFKSVRTEGVRSGVQAALDEAVRLLFHGAHVPDRISVRELVAPFERLVANQHVRWESDSSNIALGCARAVLWFFLDIFSHPSIHVLAPHGVAHSVLRGLIERDPVFSDSPDVSLRQVVYEEVCPPFAARDYAGIFQLLAEQSVLQEWSAPHADGAPFTAEDVALARNLLEEYAVGDRALFDRTSPAQVERLQRLGFLVPTAGHDGPAACASAQTLELRQARTDRAWLAEFLTSVFSSSVNVAQGHSVNSQCYSRAEDLLAAAVLCSLLCYNACGTGDGVMERFAQQCRFVHADPLAPWCPPPSYQQPEASYGKANIFLIRNAHLSTFAHLTGALRAMYTDGTDGAPYYARVDSHGRVRKEPPRLVIEIDPVFSSELLVWLESYRVGLAAQCPGTVFHCVAHDRDYDPYDHFGDAASSPRESFGAIMALGASSGGKKDVVELARGLSMAWVTKHTKRSTELLEEGRAAPLTELSSVGEWMVMRRRMRSKREELGTLFIDSAVLARHRDAWRFALYIFTRATEGKLFIRDEDPLTLAERLCGVMAATTVLASINEPRP